MKPNGTYELTESKPSDRQISVSADTKPSAIDDNITNSNYADLQQQGQIQQNNNQASQKQENQQLYRPEIDGLKFLAISVIVISNVWPKFVPGGFIGVDMLFVIFGFLLFQTLSKSITQDKLSLINFLSKKIKRIYPTLILVFLFSFYVIWNTPNVDIKNSSLKTLDSSLFLSTNLELLIDGKEASSPDMKSNPLAHLWSISVGAQCLIIWMILHILIQKFFKNRTLIILGVFTIISFSLSIVSIYLSPRFAFYFPLCRLWQILMGGVLASFQIEIQNKIVNNVLSVAGLIMILLGCFFINRNSFFPGFWALIPTLGAVMIIQAKQQSLMNKFILSSKTCVWVGKLSYSLYIWHWPFLALSSTNHLKSIQSILSSNTFMLSLSIAVSVVSYFLFENLIKKMRSIKILYAILVLIILIGLVSIPFYAKNDSGRDAAEQQRLRQEQERINREAKERQQAEKEKANKQQADKEKSDQEKAQKEKADKEKSEQQKAQKEKQQKQKQEKERIQRQLRQKQEQQRQIRSYRLITEEQYKNLDDTNKQYFFNKLSQQIAPGPFDYVTVNGSTYPNFSFNKNRTNITNNMQINAIMFSGNYDNDHGGQQIVGKKIDNSSIYSTVNVPWLHFYNVANEGKKNQLFLIGDSHMKKLSYRFQELYRLSVEANKTDEFPTIVTAIKEAWELTESNYLLNFTRQLVKAYKPQRMFLACNWLCYLCYDLNEELSTPAKCNQSKTDQSFKDFINFVIEIRNQGVQVFTNGMDINAINLNPYHIFQDLNQNIKPFKYSDFRKKFQKIIDQYETALKENNIPMIDLADNLCWQDTCHVLSPRGYAVFVDRDHYSKYFPWHWLTVVDNLTKF